MVSLESDTANPPMVGVDENGLENPKTVDDVVKKHETLKIDGTQKRGRGRPRKNPEGPGAARSGSDVPTDLFTPETVRPFVELPFGLAKIWFKSDTFTLEPRESDTLALQGATVANLYAPGWNPKAVARVAFSLGFATIATKKFLAFSAERREKKKSESAT